MKQDLSKLIVEEEALIKGSPVDLEKFIRNLSNAYGPETYPPVALEAFLKTPEYQNLFKNYHYSFTPGAKPYFPERDYSYSVPWTENDLYNEMLLRIYYGFMPKHGFKKVAGKRAFNSGERYKVTDSGPSLAGEDALRKASLLAGLRLYGCKRSFSEEIAEWAVKWGIKFKIQGSGLIWTYPKEFVVEKFSKRLRQTVADSGLSRKELLSEPFPSDEFEYAFRTDGHGFDTGPIGTTHLLAPEVTKDGYIYTLFDDTITKLVFDLTGPR